MPILKRSFKHIRRVGYGYLQPRKRKKLFLWLGLIILVFIALGWGVWRDESVKAWVSGQVKGQLAARGLKVEFRDLGLDPLGRLVAQDLEVFQTRGDQVTNIHVDHVRFSLNWFSWWRGQPFITGARIRNASIRVPITAQTAFVLHNLDADVEIKTGVLVVRSAKARLGEVRLNGSGILQLEPEGISPTSVDNQAMAEVWEKIQREVRQLSTAVAVQMEFEGALQDPLAAQARFTVFSKDLWVRGLFIPLVDIQADYEDRVLRLDQLRIQLGRGTLNGQGVLNVRNRTGIFTYAADMDFQATSGLLPQQAYRILDPLTFTYLPHVEGSLECQWNESFSFFTQATLNVNQFLIGSYEFEYLRAHLSFDGKQMLLADFSLKDLNGQLQADLLLDADHLVHGKLTSTLDFTKLRPFFGEGAQPFLSSLNFSKKPPQIVCKVEGNLPPAELMEPGQTLIDGFKFEGTLKAEDFSYTNGKGTRTELLEVHSPLRFEQSSLYLPELYVKRVAGEECWAQVDYHFKDRFVVIRNGRGYVNIQKAAPVFGPKLEEYVQPYRFQEPIRFKADGAVDLQGQEQTNLTVDVESTGKMEYTFLKKDVDVRRLNAHLTFKGKTVHAEFKAPTQIFDGKVRGVVDLELEGGQPPFQAQMSWSDASLQQALMTYFNKEDATGSVRGNLSLSGKLNNLKSLRGGGEIIVEDGEICEIPVLGGTSKASEGKSIFSFDDGLLQIEEVEIASSSFVVIGSGSYDMVLDDVNLSLRVNMRGPLGIALFPISKLFEYEGRGPLGKVEWNSKSF